MPKRPLDLCTWALTSCEPRGWGLVRHCPYLGPFLANVLNVGDCHSMLGISTKSTAPWNFGYPQLINSVDFCAFES
jgi:hypothetical protein